MNLILVGAGGLIGSIARYGVATAIQSWRPGTFPLATLTINLLGCLALGVLTGWLARAEDGGSLALFVGTGFLAAFTTFSTFALDSLKLIEGGSPGAAALNVGIQVILGIAAVALGRLLC